MARELILKLGKKITDRVDVKLGMTQLDETSPEYYGLASVVTDEMAELALAMKVRVPTTPAEIGKKVGKLSIDPTTLSTEQFGGSGMVNPRVKMSKKEEWDTRKNSIAINLAPMCVAVFSCTPYEEAAEPEKKKTAEKRKRPARQPSVKLPASPLDVISEKVGQIIKTARESRH